MINFPCCEEPFVCLSNMQKLCVDLLPLTANNPPLAVASQLRVQVNIVNCCLENWRQLLRAQYIIVMETASARGNGITHLNITLQQTINRLPKTLLDKHRFANGNIYKVYLASYSVYFNNFSIMRIKFSFFIELEIFLNYTFRRYVYKIF